MKISKPYKRILILCEGVTEYLYAKSLQCELPRNIQRSISIEIDFNSRNDPRSLAEEAKKRKRKAKKERNPFDTVWLFFDHDNWPQLEAAFSIINSEKLSIAYSSICIEHWFILHFQECGKSFLNGSEAKEFLKKRWPEYHKTKIKHFEVLRSKMERAIKRAKHLRENIQTDLPEHQRNPYFTLDKLIDFFNSLKE